MRDYVTAGGTTTYYLYDGASPVLEETYSGSTTTIQVANGFADGWRERAGGGGFNAYAFDPQGTLQGEDVNSNTLRTAVNTYVYDGYGDFLGGLHVGTGALTGYNQDPVQFGGQYGYYTDLSTGEVDLTHRYYDPSTGHFLNRDPIGYNGGQNLYAFCDNNPITRADPSGSASQKVPLGPGQYYIELDSFIPDKSITLGTQRFDFGTFKGDGRTNDPNNPSARSYEGYLIDTLAGKVTRASSGTGDTHEISGVGSPYVGNSDKLGRTLWDSTASRDAAGDFTIHFQALSANPRYPIGIEPVIEYDIELTFNNVGALVSSSGIHSAFPGFEIYEYGGGEPKQLYIWDPHNSFDLYQRQHWNYDPGRGLNTLVNLNGSVHGFNSYAQ